MYTVEIPVHDKKMIFEEWRMGPKGKYLFNNTYNAPDPDDVVFYGQSLFADLDSDGNMEHLLPACKDRDCFISVIFVYKDNKVMYSNIDY